MKKDNFIKGTIVAYLSILFIKILGALYVIPFYNIIGETGGTLYNYAYQIYNLFFSISTAGIPVALSIILSEYNSLNKYKSKEKTFKVAKKLVTILTLLCFIILFVFAPFIGKFFISGIEGTTNIKDISFVIRCISFCLLIIPFLSITRGKLQAEKYVTVSSVSQILEQVVRIGIVLLNSYLFIKVLHYDIVYGVGASLFGALAGGLVAYIYLIIKSRNNKEKTNNSEKDSDVPVTRYLIKKIISYSIPMILISVISDLYNIVDIKMIIIGLTKIGYEANTSEVIASILSTWAPKICVIIMAVATGMVTSIIPHIVDDYTSKDMNKVNSRIESALKTMLLVTIPLCIGISFLSKPIYYIFYGTNIYGSKILILTAIINVICALVTILNTILQCMKQFKSIYINTIIGLLVNVVLDIPMILLLNKLGLSSYVGTSVSSIIGYSVSVIIAFITLHKITNLKVNNIFKYFIKLLIPNICITILLIILNYIIPISINSSYISIISLLILYTVLSIIIYFIVVIKLDLLSEISDNKIISKIISKIRRK